MAYRVQQRGRGDDVETWQWVAAIRTNGGDVTAQRLMIISRFIAAEKAAGTWHLTDDYWALWGENEIQALTSLKQRRLATVTAAPTFTADRGYAFNGTTQYINPAFIQNVHSTATTGNNVRMAVYERAEATVGQSMAGNSAGAAILQLAARNTVAITHRFHTSVAISYTHASSLGYTAASRNGDTMASCTAFRNGVSQTQTVSAPTFSSIMLSNTFYIGAHGGPTGTASSFRATSIGFACFGGTLSDAQELAQYNAVQAWATSIGAQV